MIAEPAPARDVSLLLVARGGDASRLPAWLNRVREDAELSPLPLVVLHEADLGTEVAEACAGVPGVSSVEIPDGGRDVVAASLGRVFDSLTTRYVAVAALPRKGSGGLRTIKRQLRQEHEDAATVVGGPRPLLLATTGRPMAISSSYLNHVLATTSAPSGTTGEYLARVALRSATGTVEGIDPRDGNVSVLVRLNFGSLGLARRPPWRFAVALVGPSGEVARSAPVRLDMRVDRHGERRWEHLQVLLPLGGVTSGEYRLVVTTAEAQSPLAATRELRPSPGLLLGARSVRMASRHDGDTSDISYLAHTTGDAKVTRLTVQRGSGRRATGRWNFRLLKKDARYVLRGPGGRAWRLRRLLRLLTAPFFARRHIWLIGERPDTAQDNGFHLFRHLRREEPSRSVYYLIDETSQQYERVGDLGNVVRHSSLRHKLYMLHTEVLANAYSIHHMIPRGWDAKDYTRTLAWRVGALRVYLKHGVHLSPDGVKRGSAGYDMILTVMPRESEALRVASGYEEQIVEVGLPRYDALTPGPRSRTILFMSTWRRYLVPKVFGGAHGDQIPFEGSRYEQFMSSFLSSPRLQDMLAHYNYRLVFLPHYNLAEHFPAMPLAGERVSLADTDTHSFQDLIRDCDGFMTDHSSVQFDVAYLGTPMVYARFDREDFETRHTSPSWFDYEREGFGPVTYTLEDALDALEDMLASDCVQPERYARRIEDAFSHRDHDNSRRTVAAIDARLAGDASGRAVTTPED